MHLGIFADEVEAARVRDRWAFALQGRFAWLNFPEDFRGQDPADPEFQALRAGPGEMETLESDEAKAKGPARPPAALTPQVSNPRELEKPQITQIDTDYGRKR